MKARQAARRKARIAGMAGARELAARQQLAAATAALHRAADRQARIAALLLAAQGGDEPAALAAAAGIRAMLHPAAEAARADHALHAERRSQAQAAHHIASASADRLREQAQDARRAAAAEAEAFDLLNRAPPRPRGKA